MESCLARGIDRKSAKDSAVWVVFERRSTNFSHVVSRLAHVFAIRELAVAIFIGIFLSVVVVAIFIGIFLSPWSWYGIAPRSNWYRL